MSNNERCLQIYEYFSDILDKTASYEIEDMFFDHLSGCEKCRSRFEVAKSLHEALRDEGQKTSTSFSDDVMEKIKVASAHTSSYGGFFKRHRVAVIAICFAALVCLIAGGATLALLQSKPVQNIETEQKPVTTNNDADFINGFVEKITGGASSNSSSWTTDRFLSLANSPVAGEQFAYIAFLQVKSDTLFGMNEGIEYIKNSQRGGVAFYKTTLSSGDIVSLLGTVLVKDCLLSGSGSAGLLVVLCS